MSWLSRSSDERLLRSLQNRRDVTRGPVPESSSAYVDDELGRARAAAYTFATNLVFFVILVGILVAATSYYALYSGALRWLLFAAIIALFGFVLARFLGKIARDPPRLVARETSSPVAGDLGRLRTTMRRADSGLSYSQLLFEEKLRKAFLEKVRVSRNLSREDLDARTKDPERLQALLGDEVLTGFILETERSARLYPASLPSLPKRKDFARRAAHFLDRMETWQ